MVFSHLSLGGISEASACFLSIPSLDSRLCLAWSRVQFLVFSQKFLCPSLFRLCCGRVVDNVFRQTNKQTQTQSSRRLLRRKIASGHLGSACVVPWRTHLYCCASLTSSVQALRGTTPFLDLSLRTSVRSKELWGLREKTSRHGAMHILSSLTSW